MDSNSSSSRNRNIPRRNINIDITKGNSRHSDRQPTTFDASAGNTNTLPNNSLPHTKGHHSSARRFFMGDDKPHSDDAKPLVSDTQKGIHQYNGNNAKYDNINSFTSEISHDVGNKNSNKSSNKSSNKNSNKSSNKNSNKSSVIFTNSNCSNNNIDNNSNAAVPQSRIFESNNKDYIPNNTNEDITNDKRVECDDEREKSFAFVASPYSTYRIQEKMELLRPPPLRAPVRFGYENADPSFNGDTTSYFTSYLPDGTDKVIIPLRPPPSRSPVLFDTGPTTQALLSSSIFYNLFDSRINTASSFSDSGRLQNDKCEENALYLPNSRDNRKRRASRDGKKRSSRKNNMPNSPSCDPSVMQQPLQQKALSNIQEAVIAQKNLKTHETKMRIPEVQEEESSSHPWNNDTNLPNDEDAVVGVRKHSNRSNKNGYNDTDVATGQRPVTKLRPDNNTLPKEYYHHNYNGVSSDAGTISNANTSANSTPNLIPLLHVIDSAVVERQLHEHHGSDNVTHGIRPKATPWRQLNEHYRAPKTSS